MSSYDRVKAFVRKRPVPSMLRTDGGEKIAIVQEGSWVQTAKDALEGLSWGSVQALDERGAILRTLQAEADDQEESPLPSAVGSDYVQIANCSNMPPIVQRPAMRPHTPSHSRSTASCYR